MITRLGGPLRARRVDEHAVVVSATSDDKHEVGAVLHVFGVADCHWATSAVSPNFTFTKNEQHSSSSTTWVMPTFSTALKLGYMR